MNRDLDLALQYLTRQRAFHLQQAHKTAAQSRDPLDWAAIVSEAKAAALVEKVIVDLKLLDSDSAEFVKKFLL